MAKHISNISLFIVSIKSMAIGLRLTLKHFFIAIGVKRKPQVGVMDAGYFQHKEGIVTNLYPFESIPVPDNGRYRLHNEVDDCIVCDLCAKVCPVNCIDIEPIKSPVEIGKTSDGSTKRIYAAKFDIDMAKCCFCGLCTTVCPTECLTMTKTYDFSEYNVSNMVYHFAELSPAEGVLKKEEMERLVAEEKAKKAAGAKPAAEAAEPTADNATPAAKPAFKPKVAIPAVKKPVTEEQENKDIANTESSTGVSTDEKSAAPKPIFKPKVMIPAVKKPAADETTGNKETENAPATTENSATEKSAAPKPVFKPKVVIPAKKPAADETSKTEQTGNTQQDEASKPVASAETAPKPQAKPVMKPVMKPVIPKAAATESADEKTIASTGNPSAENIAAPKDETIPAPKPKPVMKPVMKPVIPKKPEEGGETNV